MENNHYLGIRYQAVENTDHCETKSKQGVSLSSQEEFCWVWHKEGATEAELHRLPKLRSKLRKASQLEFTGQNARERCRA